VNSPPLELITATAVLSTGAAALLYLALIAIAVFVVRPAKASAAITIAVSGVIALASLCVSAISPIGLSRTTGTDDFVAYTAVLHMITAATHVVWFSCLLAGIVQLARANKSEPREGD
jgi:hypothetical protein